MKAALTDTTLWNAVQDQAALTGWAEQSALIDAATEALFLRHKLRTDDARENIRGRLSALWIKRMTITGAI